MGRNLIERGAPLDEYIIESLIKLGVMSVYIQDGEYDPEDPDKVLSPLAAEKVAKLRTADRTKVTLSDSVKKQVSEGIAFMYNNTDSKEFAHATDSIAGHLMNAINENDAIAIDISALKTSDEYTFKHSVDVATISMIVAKQLGMSQQQIYDIVCSNKILLHYTIIIHNTYLHRQSLFAFLKVVL